MFAREAMVGHTLVLEIEGEHVHRTVMVPLDHEGNSMGGDTVREDGQRLGVTRAGDEILVGGKRERVLAAATTIRMRLALDD
jgi:hypothetical protein